MFILAIISMTNLMDKAKCSIVVMVQLFNASLIRAKEQELPESHIQTSLSILEEFTSIIRAEKELVFTLTSRPKKSANAILTTTFLRVWAPFTTQTETFTKVRLKSFNHTE